MPGWLKTVGKIGWIATKAAFPAANAVEAAIEKLKDSPGGASKLEAAETMALASIDLVEQVTDKDLLVQPKVSAAYRGLISAYITFMNALAEAKASRPTASIG